MDHWRVSVQRRDGEFRHLVVSGAEGACWSELLEKLLELGFDGHDLRIEGEYLRNDQVLADCEIRHGSRFVTSPHTPRQGAGWYAIAVAGPDTGTWKRLEDSGLVIGRDTQGPTELAEYRRPGAVVQAPGSPERPWRSISGVLRCRRRGHGRGQQQHQWHAS